MATKATYQITLDYHDARELVMWVKRRAPWDSEVRQIAHGIEDQLEEQEAELNVQKQEPTPNREVSAKLTELQEETLLAVLRHTGNQLIKRAETGVAPSSFDYYFLFTQLYFEDGTQIPMAAIDELVVRGLFVAGTQSGTFRLSPEGRQVLSDLALTKVQENVWAQVRRS